MSKRGRRRLFVLMIILAALSAGAAAITMAHAVRQRHLVLQARRQGIEAYASGDLEVARKNLRIACEQSSNDLEACLLCAQATLRQPGVDERRLLDAVDLYANRCLPMIGSTTDPAAQNKQFGDVLAKLLQLYGRLGFQIELAQTADKLLTINSNSVDALTAKVECLLVNNESGQALRLAERLTELEPQNMRWRRFQLELFKNQGMLPEQRLEHCRQWAAQFSGDGRCELLVASTLIEMGRMDDARNSLRKAIQSGATDRDGLEQTVALLDAVEMDKQADETLAMQKRQEPPRPWVREIAVRRMWRDGHAAEALSELNDARLALGTLNPELHQLNVLCLIAAARADEAREALRPLLALSPAAPEFDDERSWAAAVLVAIDDAPSHMGVAIDLLLSALSDSPNDPALHFLLADAYQRAGDLSASFDALRRAFLLDPDWSTVRTACEVELHKANPAGRAAWMNMTKRLDESIARQALLVVSSVTTDPPECVELVNHWISLGKRSGDESCFRQAQLIALRIGESQGFQVQSLIAQGIVAEGMRDWPGAERMYRQALTLEPDLAIAMNNLASVMSQSQSRCDEALPLITRAIQTHPDQPDLLETRARVLMGLNRFDEADVSLDRALVLRPGDPGMTLTLLESRLRQNRVEEVLQGLDELQMRLRQIPYPDPNDISRLQQIRDRLRAVQAAAAP